MKGNRRGVVEEGGGKETRDLLKGGNLCKLLDGGPCSKYRGCMRLRWILKVQV